MSTTPEIEAQLLGTAQDGGVPHIGCECPRCTAAHRDPSLRRRASCLALVAGTRGWLVDATPDLPEQLHRLSQRMGRPARETLAGILLTHAHMGHIAGLLQLGREAWASRDLPVYATPRLAAFLRENAPWRALVEGRHVRLCVWHPGETISLASGLRVTPRAVPHRDEWSNTVALSIGGPTRRLFYCPDIDAWEPEGEPWFASAPSFRAFLDGFDIALLDGTFFSADELPGRDLSTIPHPLVTDTMARLHGTGAHLCFIHLNHSNPLLAEGPEREWLRAQGADIGGEGQCWAL